jgi:hypothetical protein
MKNLIACFVILLSCTLAFSQVNKDARKIKREGIKELRLFADQNDSVPCAFIYYDREGNAAKLIFIDLYGDSPMTWQISSVEYDSIGRETKRNINFSTRANPDKKNFILLDDESVTYTYKGDSVAYATDSAWSNAHLVAAKQTKYTREGRRYPLSRRKPAQAYGRLLFFGDWEIEFAKKYYGKGKTEIVYW